MPLKLNVGLSRKVGEANYGSKGANVNVEMELESTLVSEPAKLKDRIRQLFDVVRSSLTEELNGHGNGNGNGHAPQNGNGNGNANGNPQNGNLSNGNGQSSNQNQSKPPRPATASQIKALYAIAKSQRLDLQLILQNRFRTHKAEDLSLKQASELIDTLKSGNGSNGG